MCRFDLKKVFCVLTCCTLAAAQAEEYIQFSGISDASAGVVIGTEKTGYKFLIADDEEPELHLFSPSGGAPEKIFPIQNQLALSGKQKEFDLEGNTVHQGLAVMGNKGTSDQHSYVQQLVAGPENIFVTFVQVLKDRAGASMTVGEDSTSGDYLNAFMLGTKKALEDHDKHTLLLTVPEADAYHIGQLIAVFERAVSMYAIMIGINAYHQPAVEFGKKAAGGLIDLKNRAAKLLLSADHAMTAQELANMLDAGADDVFRLMLHLCSNDPRFTVSLQEPIAESTFGKR